MSRRWPLRARQEQALLTPRPVAETSEAAPPDGGLLDAPAVPAPSTDPNASKRRVLLDLIAANGAVSSAEARAVGVLRQYLNLLRHRGVLARLSHGLYGVPAGDTDAPHRQPMVVPSVPRSRAPGRGSARFHRLRDRL